MTPPRYQRTTARISELCDLFLLHGDFQTLVKSHLWLRDGGGEGTRTHDPLVANQVLYQLSYAPMFDGVTRVRDRGPVERLPFWSLIQDECQNGGPDRSRTCDLPLIRRTL